MIDIFIGNYNDKLDLTEDVRVLMNYELEKLQNPTIIKNNFSKTITLNGTPNNNKIFGYIYQLDRRTNIDSGGYYTNVFFDASKRVPFTIYDNSTIIEQGYLQLNRINVKGENLYYEITLYGGLGDFFYSLSYKDDGEEKTLADLTYLSEGYYSQNYSLLNFTINKDTVNQAWLNINNDSSLYSTINFIPSYNGLYEDFDSDKVLINTYANSNFSTTSTTVDNETYTTYNGYAMGELNEEYTEWEMRDLRSYKQRPALRLKRFIQAVCDPVNNGGYEVELDPVFFNNNNPYYQDTWIALPLLSSNDVDSETTKLKATGYRTSLINTPSATQVLEGGSKISVSGYTTNNVIDFTNQFGYNAEFDISCDFNLIALSDFQATDTPRTSLYLSRYDAVDEHLLWSSIGVWLEARVNDTVVGTSNCMLFSNNMYKQKKDGEIEIRQFTLSDFDGNYRNNPNTNFYTVNGAFLSEGVMNVDGHYIFDFVDVDSGTLNKSWTLKMNNVPAYDNMTIELKIARWYSNNNHYPFYGSGDWYPYLYDATTNTNKNTNGIYANPIKFDMSISSNINTKSLTNMKVTKKDLLKNQITPASLLTSYSKLFGLYYIKDCVDKKIKILTRNSFFDGGIVDIEDKIDRNDMSITPLVYDKKWYLLKSPALDSYKMTEYKKNYYNAEYGQKRLNTNFNFNTEVEDIYSGNQYQNIITYTDSGKYYRHFPPKNLEANFAPPFCVDGMNYLLYKNPNESTEIEYSKVDLMNVTDDTISFNVVEGADAMSKLCCFNKDADKQSLNDINVSLVFYNGKKYLTDVEGNPIDYLITDDTTDMFVLNDNPTYIYTESPFNARGERIAYITNQIPQFTRYNIQNNNVVHSLDFGKPLETYIGVNYPDGVTLYDNYWKGLYNDQFSVDTRKVTATIITDGMMNNESLRKFYYFDNCYWILNKIIDYDVSIKNRQRVKCEFIKVNNITNYQNQLTFISLYYIEADVENCSLSGQTDNYVNYNGTYTAQVVADYGVQDIKITMGGRNITNRCWNSATNTINITGITDDVYIWVLGKEQSKTDVELVMVNTLEGDNRNNTLYLDVNDSTELELEFDSPQTSSILIDNSDIWNVEMRLAGQDFNYINGNYYITYWGGATVAHNFIAERDKYVVLVDGETPNLQKIKVVVEGAGYQSWHRITHDLTNCGISNDTLSVANGTPYTATLYSTYGVENVRITMGNVDITRQVYNSTTQTINIPSVTADVVIYAEGVEITDEATLSLLNEVSGYADDSITIYVNETPKLTMSFDTYDEAVTTMQNTDVYEISASVDFADNLNRIYVDYVIKVYNGADITGTTIITPQMNYGIIFTDASQTIRSVELNVYR